ncbi:MAG: crotonase/enoyl-CoA hydratase family protein [Acidimicrobiia bacterium]|nr:crotonase/enoyl-CoA hydratase family protein [Acidimicrobiia bacterium]
MTSDPQPEPTTGPHGSAGSNASGEAPDPPALVRVERRGPVGVIHLDDGRANALGPPMLAAIEAAFDEIEADPELAAIVVVGRPGRFSAGFDLNLIRSGDTDAVKAMVRRGGDLVMRCYGPGLPVVAACTGHALAAGALLLLGCDVRVGPDTTGPEAPKIGLNEVAIGLTLPPWALAIAKERLNPLHAQRAVVNGHLADGPTAVAMGYLDLAVPANEVVERAVYEATVLAALDRDAYTATVTAFRGPVLEAMDHRSGS